MRQVTKSSMIAVAIVFAFIVLLSWSGLASAEEQSIPLATSSGKITIVNAEGPFVMIQKANGKRVSLELTPETTVTLDGKELPVAQLSALEPGYMATAEHYTNDAGMQQTVRLVVESLRTQ